MKIQAPSCQTDIFQLNEKPASLKTELNPDEPINSLPQDTASTNFLQNQERKSLILPVRLKSIDSSVQDALKESISVFHVDSCRRGINTSVEDASKESASTKEDASKSNEENKKEWTVLYYIDGKNNLSDLAKRSFKSIQKEGSDENVNMVALLAIKDEHALMGKVIDRDSDELKNVNATNKIFPGAEDLGLVYMDSAVPLIRFISWGMKEYPAKHYALVMWDHGGGFTGSMSDDDSGGMLSNAALGNSLKLIEDVTGNHIDLINFNACLMAQAEVAYELNGKADYLVASEEVEAALMLPGHSGTTPQRKVIADLKKGIKERGEITPEELAKLYVFESKNQFGSSLFTSTQSAIDLRKIPELKDCADNLAMLLLQEIDKDPSVIDDIRKIIKETQLFNSGGFSEPYKDYRDLGNFAKNLMNEPRFKGTCIFEAAEKLLLSVKNSVIAEEHSLESATGKLIDGATGISVYLPTDYCNDLIKSKNDSNTYDATTHGYEDTGFARNTRWDELLKAISKNDDIIGKISARSPFLSSLGGMLPEVSNTYSYIIDLLALIPKMPEGFSLTVATVPHLIPFLGTFFGIGLLGGAIIANNGFKMIRSGIKNEHSKNEKAKLLFNGSLELSKGVCSVLGSGSILAGSSIVAPYAGAAALAIGLGRAALSLVSGLYKSCKASMMTVTEKLEAMKK